MSNNKKKYKKPVIEVITLRSDEPVLAIPISQLNTKMGSGARYWQGTEPTKGATWGIVDSPSDRIFTHGQGDGGSGNRSKGDIWSSWDED